MKVARATFPLCPKWPVDKTTSALAQQGRVGLTRSAAQSGKHCKRVGVPAVAARKRQQGDHEASWAMPSRKKLCAELEKSRRAKEPGCSSCRSTTRTTGPSRPCPHRPLIDARDGLI